MCESASFAEIADLCRAYARAREALETVSEEIAAERRQAVRRRLRQLKRRAAEASAARGALKAAIGANPQLFERPRTRAVEGIRIGYRKRPGRIEVADEARAIGRIRLRLPARGDELIRTRESLDRAALKRLDARALAQIGVSLVESGDEIVVAAAVSDLDTLVDALLADSATPEKDGLEKAA